MSKLFIIGNGFDLAHKIPSRYEDFRLYLISLLNQVSGKDYSQYDFTDGSIITTNYNQNIENDILTIMYFLSNAEHGKEWNNVERSVGELDYDDFSWLYMNESDTDKEYRANLINEDIFSPYFDVLKSIPDYFSKWIKQIDINNYKKYIKHELFSLFSGNSKFLCFNYTDTLESLYLLKPQNICYIHGKAKNKDSLYFGHGNDKDYDYYLNMQDINYLSVADDYTQINGILRKPVDVIIQKNALFFESLVEVDEVYSYGFSYSSVDEPYIREIINSISNAARWKIHSCPSVENKVYYKNVIKQCGFQGIVEEFN